MEGATKKAKPAKAKKTGAKQTGTKQDKAFCKGERAEYERKCKPFYDAYSVLAETEAKVLDLVGDASDRAEVTDLVLQLRVIVFNWTPAYME